MRAKEAGGGTEGMFSWFWKILECNLKKDKKSSLVYTWTTKSVTKIWFDNRLIQIKKSNNLELVKEKEEEEKGQERKEGGEKEHLFMSLHI